MAFLKAVNQVRNHLFSLGAGGGFCAIPGNMGCSVSDAVAHQGVQTQCLWFMLEIVFACLSPTGTSGELGGIRQIKIEPDELDIIQITVPGGHRLPAASFSRICLEKQPCLEQLPDLGITPNGRAVLRV